MLSLDGVTRDETTWAHGRLEILGGLQPQELVVGVGLDARDWT